MDLYQNLLYTIKPSKLLSFKKKLNSENFNKYRVIIQAIDDIKRNNKTTPSASPLPASSIASSASASDDSVSSSGKSTSSKSSPPASSNEISKIQEIKDLKLRLEKKDTQIETLRAENLADRRILTLTKQQLKDEQAKQIRNLIEKSKADTTIQKETKPDKPTQRELIDYLKTNNNLLSDKVYNLQLDKNNNLTISLKQESSNVVSENIDETVIDTDIQELSRKINEINDNVNYISIRNSLITEKIKEEERISKIREEELKKQFLESSTNNINSDSEIKNELDKVKQKNNKIEQENDKMKTSKDKIEKEYQKLKEDYNRITSSKSKVLNFGLNINSDSNSNLDMISKSSLKLALANKLNIPIQNIVIDESSGVLTGGNIVKSLNIKVINEDSELLKKIVENMNNSIINEEKVKLGNFDLIAINNPNISELSDNRIKELLNKSLSEIQKLKKFILIR